MPKEIDILIVDDDRLFREELIHVLAGEEYSVEAVGSIAECRNALRETVPLVMLLDVQLPDGKGTEYLKELAGEPRHPEIIMVSGAASLQDAADSIKDGAADFIEKPFEPQRLISTVHSIIRIARLSRANSRLIDSHLKEYEIIGESAAISSIREQIRRIADTDARILITGESGTGKELVAGQIHYLSRRSGAPFVKLNCSALPLNLVESELFGHLKGSFTGAVRDRAGRFVQANGGTLLLDEIGEMPSDIQPKLLRVIETGRVEPVGGVDAAEVDVRLISSTNRDIDQLVRDGRFRSDLMYRINAVPIQMPPLREHREDIPLLIEHFSEGMQIGKFSAHKDFDTQAVDLLVSYDWPGNVRQLRNMIERLYYTATDDRISVDTVRACLGDREVSSLDHTGDASNRLTATVAGFERSFLRTELEKTGGNITKLAERLEMDRGNLHRKLKKLGLLSH